MKTFLGIGILLVALIAGWFYFFQDRVEWKMVTADTLGIRMMYPVHSRYSATPLKGTLSTLITYDQVPKTASGFYLSTAVKNAITASKSCAALMSSGAYLPVDRQKPMQCRVTKNGSGLVTVYVIGIGRPVGGTSYPESVLLVLKADKAVIMTKLVKFPATEKLANDRVQKFVAEHPHAVIAPPDVNAKKLYEDVDVIVINAVVAPSLEVAMNMEQLGKMALSVEAVK